jgi:hypothetical protein
MEINTINFLEARNLSGMQLTNVKAKTALN